jgi:hypothetical protein
MLLEHDGEVTEMDPRVAAVELSIVKALRQHGPLRNKDLWYKTSAPYHGRDVFRAALEALVRRDVIRRLPTNRVNAFIYRMAPDKRRRERAELREKTAAQATVPVPRIEGEQVA